MKTSPTQKQCLGVSPHDFQYLLDVIKKHAGVALTKDKVYLLESRLAPLLKTYAYGGYGDLIKALRQGKKNLMTDVMNAMVTHETFFFRDTKPFQIFQEYALPMVLKTKTQDKKLRIWCAACSSGQEPYTLSMILHEKKALLKDITPEIYATDISEPIIARAKKGAYTQFEVQRGLPVSYLVKYFTQVGNEWHIAPHVKKSVHFKTLNLLDSFTHMGMFDLIFCRNVLIYFDPPLKGRILDRLRQQLQGHGYLFLGASETVMGLTTHFKTVEDKRGLYMPAT